jgi:hypothetical protein
MRRRRLLLKLSAALLVLLAGIVGLLALAPADPISEENAALIKERMTLQEVETVLAWAHRHRAYGSGSGYRRIWLGESGTLDVNFIFVGGYQRVSGPARFSPGERPPLFDRLGNRLVRLLSW